MNPTTQTQPNVATHSTPMSTVVADNTSTPIGPLATSTQTTPNTLPKGFIMTGTPTVSYFSDLDRKY